MFQFFFLCILKVLEMDGLLRNHQADTAAHRLQLERALAQRQGDLRARTQELEDITIKYTEAQKVCMCALGTHPAQWVTLYDIYM